VEQTRAYGLARVHWHYRAPAILVTKEVMATLDAKNAKPYTLKGGNEVGAGDAGIPTHAAMVTR
jgi:hypothetical protein